MIQAKKHLEIADSFTAHDDHVTGLIRAAREVWEHDTHTATTQRIVTESHEGVVDDEFITLSIRPIVSVTSVQFAGALQTTSFDAGRARVYLTDGNSWPYPNGVWNEIQIVYEAGTSEVPEIAKQAMKLQLDLMFQPERLIKQHTQAYETLVQKYMRATYP